MKTTIQIAGMRCAGCSSACEKALGKLDGVTSVSVNLASAKAEIEYNPKVVSPEKFRKTVEAAGFTVVEDIEGEKKKS